MAGPGRREDALHHPGIALGERLQRELQRIAARRASKWRDLLQSGRSQSADRGLAAALQHDPPAQQPRLPTTGPRNRDAAIAAFRFRYAPPPVGNGQGGSNAPTFNPDHLMGAGQLEPPGQEALTRPSHWAIYSVSIGEYRAKCQTISEMRRAAGADQPVWRRDESRNEAGVRSRRPFYPHSLSLALS